MGGSASRRAGRHRRPPHHTLDGLVVDPVESDPGERHALVAVMKAARAGVVGSTGRSDRKVFAGSGAQFGSGRNGAIDGCRREPFAVPVDRGHSQVPQLPLPHHRGTQPARPAASLGVNDVLDAMNLLTGPDPQGCELPNSLVLAHFA